MSKVIISKELSDAISHTLRGIVYNHAPSMAKRVASLVTFERNASNRANHNSKPFYIFGI